MIVTRFKPIEKILKSLETYQNLVLVGCDICSKECGTAGEKVLEEYKEIFEKNGKTVKKIINIEGMCNQLLVKRDIKKLLVDEVDAIICFSCGSGTQSTSEITSIPVLTSLNTIYLAKKRRIGNYEETCIMCGHCVLNSTKGVCPRTKCAKGIVNGPCGGSVNGKCEVDPEKDCAWVTIYERLEKSGELENLEKTFKPLKNINELKPRKDKI